MLRRNGGYILGPAHLFQPDVPPENILAVYQDESGRLIDFFHPGLLAGKKFDTTERER